MAKKKSDPSKLARKIGELILEKKGTDIKIMDLRKITTITDFFVICTASSDIQVKAIADYVLDSTKKLGYKAWHSEGYTNLSWVLLDFVDVVVHIFLPETRKFYNLDSLWADAEITELKEK